MNRIKSEIEGVIKFLIIVGNTFIFFIAFVLVCDLFFVSSPDFVRIKGYVIFILVYIILIIIKLIFWKK